MLRISSRNKRSLGLPWAVLSLCCAAAPSFAFADTPGAADSYGALQEVSPYVQEIEILKNELFIEVFLVGMGDLGCYDQREYDVRRNQPTKTVVVPRLKRSKPETPCITEWKSFRDKVADLDAAADSSYEIDVLSFRGWVTRQVPRDD
jgi:hypothetical protein